MMTDHLKARQYNDEMYCAHCGKTWDVNDPEPPTCLEKKTSHQQIAELRNKYKLEKHR